MRRVLATLAISGVLLGLPANAAANAPTKTTDHFIDMRCTRVETRLGLTEFSVNTDFGTDGTDVRSDAYLVVWSGEPEDSEPVLSTGFGQPVATFGLGTVTMTIPLFPSGVATVNGALTQSGTSSSQEDLRFDNAWYRASTNFTYFAFTGTLSLPGLVAPVAFGPDGCYAIETLRDRFVTDPHATVRKIVEPATEYCRAVSAEGDEAAMWVKLDFDGQFSIDGTASRSDGSSIQIVGGGSVGADGSVEFDLTQFDLATYEELPPGSASITVTDSGQKVNYVSSQSNNFFKVRGLLLDVAGSLSTSLGVFDIESCQLQLVQITAVETPTNGPKPGGKAPTNDLPTGAIAVAPGDHAVVATKGAQRLGEHNYACQPLPQYPFFLDIDPEYTVWYTIKGTGSPVTVDTAGSDFETDISVFRGSADGPLIVGLCDETVPYDTWQVVQRFDTEPGITYWVQVGGPYYYGRSNVPYGVLKVAVR